MKSLTCATLLALLGPIPVLAASADGLPTPGLYRINDTSGAFLHFHPNGQWINRDYNQSGTTGNATAIDTTSDGIQATTKVKGDGQQRTTCVPPRTGAMVPPAIPAGACVSAPGVKTPNGWVTKSNCPYADITTTSHQIDEKTWQFDMLSINKDPRGAPTGVPAMAGMKAMLESAVKHGTPQEQAKARAALAQMPALEAQAAAGDAQRKAMQPQIDAMRAQAVKEGIVLPSQDHIGETKMSYTMTRIADSCAGQKP